MTNRVKGFTITLEEDFREDDIEKLKLVIEMHKGVLHVEPSIVSHRDHMNRLRIKTELTEKLFNILK